MDKPERPDKARRKARPDSAWLLVSGAVWRDADLQGRASSWERVILNAALDAGGGRLPPDPLDALPEQLVAAYLTEGASDRIEGILRRAAGGSSGEDDGRRRACAWFLLVACLLRQGRLAEAAAAYRDGERGCRALPGGPAYSAVAASALALRLAGDRSGSAGFREAFEILKLAAKPLARASCRRGRAEPAASGGSGSPAASGGSGPPADSGGS
ncbi:MAG: hypothetical protein LBW85_03535, partial [Deltaproteobacteria bacterium]|nr:hypothetical protein [Deltaproteobacteria bacterium]